MLALLELVPLDSAIVRRAGQLRQPVDLSHFSLPDVAITASADLNGYTLLTRNMPDFAALADTLPVEFYE